MMKYNATEPASKVSLDRFLTPSGENGQKFVTNSELFPIQHTLSSTQYKSVMEKFTSVDIFIPTCLVHEAQRCYSAIADEQDAALEEIKRSSQKASWILLAYCWR